MSTEHNYTALSLETGRTIRNFYFSIGSLRASRFLDREFDLPLVIHGHSFETAEIFFEKLLEHYKGYEPAVIWRQITNINDIELIPMILLETIKSITYLQNQGGIDIRIFSDNAEHVEPFEYDGYESEGEDYDKCCERRSREVKCTELIEKDMMNVFDELTFESNLLYSRREDVKAKDLVEVEYIYNIANRLLGSIKSFNNTN